MRRLGVGKIAAMKAIAILIAFTVLSTIPSAPSESEQVAKTVAGGSSFGTPVVVNDDRLGEQIVPVIAKVPNRGLLVAWQDSRSSNSIYTSTSVNGATTFGPDVRVDDPMFNASIPRGVSVSTTNNGTILISWEDNRRNTFDYDIFFSKSFDFGASYARNVKVDDSNYTIPSWQDQSSVAVTLGGTIFVAWTDTRSGYARLMGASSNDMGRTFSASREIVPGGNSSQNQVDLVANGNKIFVAFIDNVAGKNHPYVCLSQNGGRSFTVPVRLDDTGTPGMSQLSVSIAPMPNGGVVAVWADTRNGASDIYAALVSAEGSVISSNIQVDNDSGMTYQWQENPDVASDQLGNVYAVWQDERATGVPAIRFALMQAGKTQFNASMGVANPGNTGGIPEMQLCPSVVAEGPGRVYVAWQDYRSGTADIYVAVGNFPNLYNLALGKGWNFISMFLGSNYQASTLGLMRGDMIASWNSMTGLYDKKYIVGISPSTADFPLTSSTGYWVYANAPETLCLNGTLSSTKHTKTLSVPTGGYWVAIGFESLNSTRKASDIPGMFSVNRGITAVVSYNPTTGKYSTYLVGVPPTDFRILPGQGYWLWCTTSGTLTYDA